MEQFAGTKFWKTEGPIVPYGIKRDIQHDLFMTPVNCKLQVINKTYKNLISAKVR